MRSFSRVNGGGREIERGVVARGYFVGKGGDGTCEVGVAAYSPGSSGSGPVRSFSLVNASGREIERGVVAPAVEVLGERTESSDGVRHPSRRDDRRAEGP